MRIMKAMKTMKTTLRACAALMLMLALVVPASGVTAQEGEELRVAVILPGSVLDQGYNADGERAAQLIESELGAEVVVSENVQIPNQTDVYRQFAAQGFDLVIGWGGQFTDGALEAAEEFPATTFLVVNSGASNGTNMGSIDTAIEDWQFLAGYAMAKLSESGTVGWVGGLCFPATAANLHGTEQGARFADPDIEFLSTFTGDFEDPTKAAQAAQAMIEQGADVLTQNLNNGVFGMIDAAGSAGNVRFISEWVDNSELAPEVIASSVLKSQARFALETARAVQDGSFEAGAEIFGLPDDWGPAISDSGLLPDGLHEELLSVQARVASGEIEPEHDETCPGQ